MANKAELEADWSKWRALSGRALDAERRHDFVEAVRLALDCLPHLPNALTYDQKWGNAESADVRSVRLILQYAPLFFLRDALAALGDFLRERKRIGGKLGLDLSDELASAHERLHRAARLWDDIRLGRPKATEGAKDAAVVGTIFSAWERAGLVVKAAGNGYAFVTSYERPTRARCHGCGTLRQGERHRFYDDVPCPRCRKPMPHAILT